MKKRVFILGVIMIMLLVGSSFLVAQEGCEILEVKMREVDRSSSSVKVAWLVKVRNNSDTPQNVYVKVQFVDKDGFELDDGIQEATIQPGETAIVTDKTSIDIKVFPQVVDIRAYL